MKNFRERVKQKMEKEGWTVDYVIFLSVDLRCRRGNMCKYIRARGNGHGHIYRDSLNKMENFKKILNARILIAKVNSDNEIVFYRLDILSKTIKGGK